MTEQNSAVAQTSLPLQVWDKVEIVVDRDNRQGIYISRIEDIQEGWMITSRPEFVGGAELLTNDETVYVQFNMPDALYRFGARIKMLGEEQNNRVVISNFGRLERVQRREFVRIGLHLELRYCVIKKDGINIENPHWQSSLTRDFSAGGMQFPVEDEINEGDLLLIRVKEFGVGDSVLPHLFLGECRRNIQNGGKRLIGVKLIIKEHISDYLNEKEMAKIPPQIDQFSHSIRNKLVYFIFEEQVRQRQKGLI